MKSATLSVLGLLAAALTSTMLVTPEAEARKGPSMGLSIGHKSGPSSLAFGKKVAPIVRDHRGTVGKLQCNGPYCSKKSIVNGTKGTTTGTATKGCLKYQGPWCRPPHGPHDH